MMKLKIIYTRLRAIWWGNFVAYCWWCGSPQIDMIGCVNHSCPKRNVSPDTTAGGRFAIWLSKQLRNIGLGSWNRRNSRDEA